MVRLCPNINFAGHPPSPPQICAVEFYYRRASKFNKNDGSKRNFAWTFYLHNAMPPSNIEPVGPPWPSQGPQQIQNGQKIHVFRIFWPLDGVEITQKCRFWTPSVPKHRNQHLTRLSAPKDGRTLQKVCGPLLPKCVVHFYPGNLVRLG